VPRSTVAFVCIVSRCHFSTASHYRFAIASPSLLYRVTVASLSRHCRFPIASLSLLYRFAVASLSLLCHCSIASLSLYLADKGTIGGTQMGKTTRSLKNVLLSRDHSIGNRKTVTSFE